MCIHSYSNPNSMPMVMNWVEWPIDRPSGQSAAAGKHDANVQLGVLFRIQFDWVNWRIKMLKRNNNFKVMVSRITRLRRRYCLLHKLNFRIKFAVGLAMKASWYCFEAFTVCPMCTMRCIYGKRLVDSDIQRFNTSFMVCMKGVPFFSSFQFWHLQISLQIDALQLVYKSAGFFYW